MSRRVYAYTCMPIIYVYQYDCHIISFVFKNLLTVRQTNIQFVLLHNFELVFTVDFKFCILIEVEISITKLMGSFACDEFSRRTRGFPLF